MRPLNVVILFLPISFAVAFAGAATQRIVVSGGGEYFAEGVYSDAMFAYSFVQPSVTIEYYPVGGPEAVCHMMTSPGPSCTSGVLGATPEYYSYGLSDNILLPGDYEANPDLQLYPTLAIPIVPVYNLNGAMGLILTPLALAQIFSGQIDTWDDARIVALNPNFTAWGVPPNTTIQVVSFPLNGRTIPFRAALAAFDPVTAAIFAGAGGSAWGCNVTYQNNTEAYVASFPYTISFTSIALAASNQVPTVTLLKPTGPITATVESALYAVLEVGLTFGNNGDAPSHLTANVVNAQGAKAWPIVAYTYLVMRKSTLLGNATCAQVQAAAEFWQWFYTNNIANTITSDQGFVPLPSIVQSFVLDRLISEIVCEGAPVLTTATQLSLVGLGVSWMSNFFGQVTAVYSLQQPQVVMSYNSTDVFAAAAQVQTALAAAPFVVSSVNLAQGTPVSEGVPLVLAGVGHVAITSFATLTLDVCTLANILDGAIRTWLHPDIVALNPGGLSTPTGNLTDTQQAIVLLAGPTGFSPGMIALFTACVPDYTGAALIMARAYTDDILLRAAVSVLPYTMAFTPLAGSFDSGLTLTSVVNAAGAAIQPSWATVQACATPETFDAATGIFDLSASVDPNCYPLSSALYATVRPSACNIAIDGARTAAVEFLTWLLSSNALAAALHEQNLAWLGGLSGVAAANAAAMAAITCQPAAGSSRVTIAIVAGVVGVVVLAILAGVGFFMRKAAADIRALRKQFSDDNVAQECAAAIARFDLDAVVWLKDAKAPTAIQTSFLRIIHLLTEVKPFIPDQLLQALRHTGPGSDTADAEDALEEEPRGNYKTPKDHSSTASSFVASDGETGDSDGVLG
jgi:phosphate transport system substrate-binding protein